MTPDEDRTSQIVRETIQEFQARQPEPTERHRKTDWNQIILLVIAIMAAVWAVFNFCFDAKMAPIDKRMSLMEQTVKTGLSRISSELKELKGSTAWVTPLENDRLEEIARSREENKEDNR